MTRQVVQPLVTGMPRCPEIVKAIRTLETLLARLFDPFHEHICDPSYTHEGFITGPDAAQDPSVHRWVDFLGTKVTRDASDGQPIPTLQSLLRYWFVGGAHVMYMPSMVPFMTIVQMT